MLYLQRERVSRAASVGGLVIDRSFCSPQEEFKPAQISTSYVERSHLTMRMHCRRFGRLTSGYSKTLPNHAASLTTISSTHESLRSTPAEALGLTNRAWSLGELLDEIEAFRHGRRCSTLRLLPRPSVRRRSALASIARGQRRSYGSAA
jgi:hypothetical protein